MVGDRRFIHEFSLALETIRLEDEADLFQRVLDVARERDDDNLAQLAVQYRDRAARHAQQVRATAKAHGSAIDALLELARVAGRHPSHFGATRPPLAAV